MELYYRFSCYSPLAGMSDQMQSGNNMRLLEETMRNRRTRRCFLYWVDDRGLSFLPRVPRTHHHFCSYGSACPGHGESEWT